MVRIPADRGSPLRAVLAALTGVAAVATAGSLYFSEVLGLVPCELCWYQRIFMYPLVVVLGVAAIENRPAVWYTGLPLSVGGAAVAAYHSYVQIAGLGTCTVGGGCTSILWQWSVFTIPRLAFVAFALISLGLVVVALADRGTVTLG